MSLTAANTVIMINQPILFPAGPQQLQGFAPDDVYDTDQVKLVEESMGVDGVLSFGFVWMAVAQNFALQADSDSNDIFDIIGTQQQAAAEVYPISGTIILPGIVTKFNMINGALTDWKPMPDSKKILQPRKYRVVWQRISPAPM